MFQVGAINGWYVMNGMQVKWVGSGVSGCEMLLENHN